MIRFLFKLSLFLPLLVLMGWLNWTIDPALLFDGHAEEPWRHTYEVRIAEDLLAGRTHEQVAPYKDALVNELIFRGRHGIDVLAFGSSIARPLYGDLFGAAKFFNASLYGGQIEEMISQYELARECGVRPKQVVLQLEGSSLSKRDAPLSDATSRRLRAARRRFGMSEQPVEKRVDVIQSFALALLPGTKAANRAGDQGFFPPYDTLLSPRYLQFALDSLLRFWQSRSDGTRFEGIDQFDPWSRHTIFPDGSVEWCPMMRDRQPSDVRLLKFDAATLSKSLLRPDRDRCRLFEAFVTDLARSGIRVEIILTPTNPWFLERAKASMPKDEQPLPLERSDALIRSFAAKNSIRVMGSLDPAQAGVSDSDYVDEIHLRREALGRLVRGESDLQKHP